MEKIITWVDIVNTFTPAQISEACGVLAPVWKVREQCRMNSGTYARLVVEGDDPTRFLHVSLDDPSMVAYTESEEDGVRDIQKRTTMPVYMEKYGLSGVEVTTAPLCAEAERTKRQTDLEFVRSK